jgi:CO/xanthine dehydrogenase Mo-binding subunit
METLAISRREFLSTLGKGTLAVGFSLAPFSRELFSGDAYAAGIASNLMVDSWLAIDQSSTITIFSGKVELGTGIQTAMMQIVAEELNVDLDQLSYVQGDTSQTPGDKGLTAGSKSVQTQGPSLRIAAATAFQTLLTLASQALNVPVANLVASNGRVGIGPNLDQALTYAQLIAGQQIQLASNPNVAVKNPSAYRIVGQPVPRIELPEKFTAEFTFVADVVLPNMLHGRIIRPSGRNATFDSVDPVSLLTAAQSVPGFLKVVHLGNFVGVIATDEWAAIQASRTIRVNWRAGAPLPTQATMAQTLQDPANTYQTSQEQVRGNVDSAMAGAAKTLHATYFTEFQMHGALAPSCAVADVKSAPDATGIRVTIWSGTQGPFPLQGAIADLLNIPVSQVRVIYVEAAGCYGHNGADDVCADAALLSQFVGRPVRVQWTRQDEHGWEPLGPAMAHQMNGGLDGSGGVAAWEHIVYTPTHNTRPSSAGGLLAAQEYGILPPALPNAPTNAGTRNAPINYTFVNSRLIGKHVRIFATVGTGRTPAAPLVNTLLRPSALRSLGGFSNTFANESFMDELASASGQDPLAFRLRNLSDPRAIAVLNAMAQQAGWSQPLASATNGLLRGRGLAFLRYETVETYVATYAEVQVNPATGAVQVTRVVVAHDCGLIINPDGLRNQIEGNVIQGISRTLFEKVSYDGNGVTSVVWTSYPVLHFTDVPPSVEIVLINQPTQPAWGAGEPTIGTLSAAIGNAVFNATGARLRTLPMSPDVVKAALA